MIFLTNKPVHAFKDVRCKLTGYSFNEIQSADISKQVVVDIAPEGNINTIRRLINMFNCSYIEAPIELVAGNIIYVIQDGSQSVIKLEILSNHEKL